MMMNIDFGCTKCGDCCRNLWLPLSIDEAKAWLKAGNPVNILCEAIPWIEEPEDEHTVALFRKERSFAALSNGLPVRLMITLAAPLGHGCPNLSADNDCRIYALRPRVCRTYPAEINPFIEFSLARRRCPPAAWEIGGGAFLRQGEYVSPEIELLIKERLQQSVQDLNNLESMCYSLHIDTAALINEGYSVYSPNIDDLLQSLSQIRTIKKDQKHEWLFATNHIETTLSIRSWGAKCIFMKTYPHHGFLYLSTSVTT